MTRGAMWLCPAAVLALTACSSQVALFEPCDIRQASCQSTIFIAVQGARNAAWDPWLDMPPMRVISKDRYYQELEAQRQAAEQDQAVDYFTPAYKAFHLYDPNESADSGSQFTADNIAAYYTASTHSVTIVDRGTPNLKSDTYVLAHELVHAAQDRDVSFEAINSWAHDVDTSHARGAIVEGEAVLYANLVRFHASAQAQDDTPDFPTYNALYLSDTRRDVAQSKSPLREARLSLRYPLGSKYMSEAWAQGGSLAVRRAIAAHPSTGLAFMSDPTLPYVSATTCTPPSPAGMRLVGHTVMGAWSLYAFLTRLASESFAWQLAQRWSNDLFTIHADEAGHLAVVWQLHFASAADANELVMLTSKLPAGVQLHDSESNARTVTLLARVGEPDVEGWAWHLCR